MHIKFVEQVMDDIGCPKHLVGYEALALTIQYQMEHRKMGVTDVYRHVAKMMDTTYASVERCIRHLIDHLQKNDNEGKIYEYFGSSVPSSGKITNKQFIYTLGYMAMQLELDELNELLKEERKNADNRR
jgi:hypothetical protein